MAHETTNQPINIINLGIIDWEGCLHMFGNNHSITRETLSLLSDRLESDQEKINKAYENYNGAMLCSELHRIRGGLSYLRLPELDYAFKCFHELFNETGFGGSDLENSYSKLKQAITRFQLEWKNALNP